MHFFPDVTANQLLNKKEKHGARRKYLVIFNGLSVVFNLWRFLISCCPFFFFQHCVCHSLKEVQAWDFPLRLRDMPTKSTQYVVQRVVKSFPCLLGKDMAILSDAATSLKQRRNELKNAHKWTPGHKGSGRHTKVNNEPSAALYDICHHGLAIARAVMSDHGELFSPGCSHCQLLGEWSEALKKVVYLENRRFLPVDDEMRESKPFPSSKAERRGPPEPKTHSYVEACNAQYEEAKTKVARSSLFKQNGCKGRHALQRLPEHDRLTDVPVEPMHTLKDCVEHLLKVSVVLLLLQFYFITTPPLLLFFFVHFSTSNCVLSLIIARVGAI